MPSGREVALLAYHDRLCAKAQTDGARDGGGANGTVGLALGNPGGVPAPVTTKTWSPCLTRLISACAARNVIEPPAACRAAS